MEVLIYIMGGLNELMKAKVIIRYLELSTVVALSLLIVNIITHIWHLLSYKNQIFIHFLSPHHCSLDNICKIPV